MDKERYALFKAEVEGQLGLVKRLQNGIRDKLDSFDRSEESVDSMAYKLHNLYGAYEQLFEIVADFFENEIEGIRYHAELLRRMKLEIEGIRPSLVSEDTYPLLDELRRFRHFFRHAYGVRLTADRVRTVVRAAISTGDKFSADLERFMKMLAPE
jgi:hypothetical protein